MKLIDADAYMEKVRHEAKAMPQKQGETFVTLSEWIMEKTPSIEPKCGEWKRRIVDNGFNADWVCSECGYRVKTDFVDYNFCPNCGTDMQKGADDEDN